MAARLFCWADRRNSPCLTPSLASQRRKALSEAPTSHVDFGAGSGWFIASSKLGSPIPKIYRLSGANLLRSLPSLPHFFFVSTFLGRTRVAFAFLALAFTVFAHLSTLPRSLAVTSFGSGRGGFRFLVTGTTELFT